MFVQSLRSHLVVTIVLVLLVGMVLIDMVAVLTTQQLLLRSTLTKGQLYLDMLADQLERGTVARAVDTTDFHRLLRHLKTDRDLGCVALLDPRDPPLRTYGPCGDQQDPLGERVRQALEDDRPIAARTGVTWGVFWREPRYALLAVPVHSADRAAAALGLSLPLESTYARLRHAQRITLIYLVVNTVVLAALGVSRMRRALLQPLQRLVERAEGAGGPGGLFFSERRQDNELQQLSGALNRMLRRIHQDNETLRRAVQSLEIANAELKRTQQEMLRAEKLASVGRLAAGVAHEIGNPIGIAMGYLELLRQTGLDEAERIDFIARTGDELQRIHRVIRQLLDVARPGAPDDQCVGVHAVIEDVARMVRHQPDMAEIDVALELAAGDDRVFGNADRLRQVFLNVVLNAADALGAVPPDHPRRLVISSADDSASGGLIVRFHDTGGGIAPERIEAIFDPFYTTKAPGKGTGLGLSVSYSIIDGMGGRIGVTSPPGGGTTVEIRLPVLAPSASVSSETA